MTFPNKVPERLEVILSCVVFGDCKFYLPNVCLVYIYAVFTPVQI